MKYFKSFMLYLTIFAWIFVLLAGEGLILIGVWCLFVSIFALALLTFITGCLFSNMSEVQKALRLYL